jgi:hypothetical protein
MAYKDGHTSNSWSGAMRYRLVLTASTWLVAAVAMAQTAPTTSSNQSDSWTVHPAASSSSYRSQPSTQATGKSHFKFKDRRLDDPSNPLNQPPPGANDKAAVMGKDRTWQNGRPPVDCASAPMDPACH